MCPFLKVGALESGGRSWRGFSKIVPTSLMQWFKISHQSWSLYLSMLTVTLFLKEFIFNMFSFGEQWPHPAGVCGCEVSWAVQVCGADDTANVLCCLLGMPLTAIWNHAFTLCTVKQFNPFLHKLFSLCADCWLTGHPMPCISLRAQPQPLGIRWPAADEGILPEHTGTSVVALWHRTQQVGWCCLSVPLSVLSHFVYTQFWLKKPLCLKTPNLKLRLGGIFTGSASLRLLQSQDVGI